MGLSLIRISSAPSSIGIIGEGIVPLDGYFFKSMHSYSGDTFKWIIDQFISFFIDNFCMFFIVF